MSQAIPYDRVRVLRFVDGIDRVEIITDKPDPSNEDEGALSLTLCFTIPRENTARYLKEHLGVTRYQTIRRRGRAHLEG